LRSGRRQIVGVWVFETPSTSRIVAGRVQSIRTAA
jgi:hypothetical protein